MFLPQLHSMGFWGSLFHPYAGYQQFIPRIATWLATCFPLQNYAVLMTLLSCAITGAVTAVVFLGAGHITSSPVVQALAAAMTFTAAAAPLEVLGNAANIHSYVFWMTPWILLARPRRARTLVVSAVLVLAAALTEIQVVYFLPLFLFRLRDRRSWWLYGALIVGVAAQAVTTLASPRSPSGHARVSMADVGWGYVTNVLGSVTFGHAHEVTVLMNGHRGWLYLLLLPVVLALVVVFWRGTADERLTAATLSAGSVMVWSAALLLNSAPWVAYAAFTPTDWAGFGFVRYTVPAALLISAVFPLCAGVLFRCGGAGRIVGLCVVALILASMVLGFHISVTGRSSGPAWSPQFDKARTSCEAGARSERILIAPTGWSALVSCQQILAK